MPTSTNPATPITIIRFPALCARLGLKRQTIYLRMKSDKNFPRPVKLGERAVGFIVAEIDEWLRGLADTRKPHAADKTA